MAATCWATSLPACSFFKDVALIEQPFVKDQKKTIKQLLSEQGVAVRAFARFQIGQAD